MKTTTTTTTTTGLVFLPAEVSEFFGEMPAFIAPAVFKMVDGKVVAVDYSGTWEEV